VLLDASVYLLFWSSNPNTSSNGRDIMKKTHLEYSKGTSSKFWEISVKGSEQSVRYGRIGTAGTKKTKAFQSRDDAIADSLKKIARKQAKGYQHRKLAPV